MGTTLTGTKIKDTYKSLIKVTNNTEAGSTGKQLSDGDGNDLGIFVDTDGVVGVGAAANCAIDASSKTDAIQVPNGTTAQRPTGGNGMIRYNSTLAKMEYYDGAWKEFAEGDIESIVAGSGLTGSSLDSGDATVNVGAGDGITVNADDIEVDVDDTTLEVDATNGLQIKGLGVDTAQIAANAITGAKIAADAITGAKIADDAIDSEHINNGSIDLAHLAANCVNGDKIVDDAIDSEHYVDGSIDTAHIADNQITHDKLENRYTALSALGTGSSFTVNFTNAATFTATANANATFTFSNAKQGQVIDIIVSGNYTITFSETGSTFNKVGGVDYDGSSNNLIQVVCTDDTSGSKIYHYAVGTYTSDSTPS